MDCHAASCLPCRDKSVDVWCGLEQSIFNEAVERRRVRFRTSVRAKGGHFKYSLWTDNVDFVRTCYIQCDLFDCCIFNYDIMPATVARPCCAVGGVAVRGAWLRWPTSLGSRPRLAGSSVSGYSGACFEIKLSGRHTGFDGVLVKLWPLANTEFRGSQSLLQPLITDDVALHGLVGH